MLVYACNPELAEMTRKNVALLLEHTTGDFEIRVLFNGGPAVALPADERIVPIYMGERSSIAKGYNLAFSQAQGEILACVHNDVSVPYGWNERMAEAVGAGFSFPMVLEDAQDCAERGIGTTQPGFPTGCCFMFPKALYEALKGFDERYEGCHFEDTDLWMRALKDGRRLSRAAVVVTHGRGKTRTVLHDGGNTDFRRNKELYIQKHKEADGSVHIPTLQEQPC
tara:strand:- start:29 stop:700 length:672 start_codon:yes stop_codon:yes gene_type:complete